MEQLVIVAGEKKVLFAQEILVSLGVFLGGLALIFSAVALGLVLAEQGRLRSIRGRSTRIKPGS